MIEDLRIPTWRAIVACGTLALALVIGEAASQEPAASQERTGVMPTSEIPYHDEWMRSPHAKRDSKAFTYWNAEGVLKEPCARCHSTPGFRDYIGADGSAAGVLSGPAPIGTVITCVACHNDRTRTLDHVSFPSGLRIEGVGSSARCMTCHQGVAAGTEVDKAVAGRDQDKPTAELVFINVHYAAAGATMMGMLARGAYQYPGRVYASRFRHPAPYNQCVSCHDPHTLTPAVAGCASCHNGLTDRASLRAIRKSAIDYNGNGNMKEGIASEIANLHDRLLDAIKVYARKVIGKPIGYEAHSHPYFFIDIDGSGIVETPEAIADNKYNAWTPRLLKAAYNYQFVAKDPGAYAHNPLYALQILYDSLEDLGHRVDVNLSGTVRP